MALKPCKECNKKISTLAKVCPNCGAPKPTFFVKKKKSINKKSSNFKESLRSFWNGEWSLLQTFWGYFVVGTTLLGLPIVATVGLINLNQESFFMTFIFWVYFFLYFIFYICTCVATWRSASNYTKIKSNKKIWSILAKIVVFLSISNNIYITFTG